MRDKVISRATQMFSEEGFKSVRMDDIASALNISKRTLYEMFENKESLVRECITYYLNWQKAEQEKISQDSANIFEELAVLLERLNNAGSRNYNMLSGLQRVYPHIFHELAVKKYREGMDHIREKLRLGVKQGLLLDTVNPDLAVAVFGYSLSGLIHRADYDSFSWPSEVSFPDAIHYIMIHFFRGIATDKGIRIIDETILKSGDR